MKKIHVNTTVIFLIEKIFFFKKKKNFPYS